MVPVVDNDIEFASTVDSESIVKLDESVIWKFPDISTVADDSATSEDDVDDNWKFPVDDNLALLTLTGVDDEIETEPAATNELV